MRVKGILFVLTLLISVVSIISTTGCSNPSNNASATVAATPKAPSVTLTVSAASSLTDVIKEITPLYTQEKPNVKVLTNFAASGTLQQQIDNGAPVDVYISAAAIQMDNLQKDQLILNETRKNLLYNKLVLAVPADSNLGITSFMDLTRENVKKVAIGDPNFVPCGMYAKETLDLLGLTAQIQPKLVMGNDVRQVLYYIETGNVDAGMVFSTDAKSSNKVKTVAVAPDVINAKIVYPVAIVKSTKNLEAAKDFESFLFSPQAQTVFEKYGFTLSNS